MSVVTPYSYQYLQTTSQHLNCECLVSLVRHLSAMAHVSLSGLHPYASTTSVLHLVLRTVFQMQWTLHETWQSLKSANISTSVGLRWHTPSSFHFNGCQGSSLSFLRFPIISRLSVDNPPRSSVSPPARRAVTVTSLAVLEDTFFSFFGTGLSGTGSSGSGGGPSSSSSEPVVFRGRDVFDIRSR